MKYTQREIMVVMADIQVVDMIHGSRDIRVVDMTRGIHSHGSGHMIILMCVSIMQ